MAHKSGFTIVHLVVVLAMVALIAALAIPAIQRSRTQSDLIMCQDHLRRIGVSLTQYGRFSAGCLPVSATIDGAQSELIADLSASHCLGDPRNYYCPAQRQSKYGYTDDHFKAGIIGYFYYSAVSPGAADLSKFLRDTVAWPRKMNRTMDKRTWVMSDIWLSAEPTAHVGYRKGVNYLMLDGSVAFIGESPRQAFH